MKIDPKYCPTDEQVEAMEIATQYATEECDKVLRIARQLFDSKADFNKHKDVKHGANTAVSYACEYMVSAALGLKELMDRDVYDYIRYKYMFANGKFQTGANWVTGFTHLYDEMKRFEPKVPDHLRMDYDVQSTTT